MVVYSVKTRPNKKEWFKNGLHHRLDGPAIEFVDGGTKYWYKDGLKHREDGPAIEFDNGEKHYYLGGRLLSLEQWEYEVKQLLPIISTSQEVLDAYKLLVGNGYAVIKEG
jgi:hypothetical protein